jgi:hypothetical protein
MLTGIIPHDELEALRTVDNGYRAALHILSCPTFGEDLRVWRFVSAKPFPGIDFPTMLRRGHFSRYEKVLLRCAWSLFNGNAKLALDDVACNLYADEIRTVIEAIRIRGGYR